MGKNLEQRGLKSIVSQYDLFFIDIWGVIHNGINIYDNAVKVLEELSKNNKEFCKFFSNVCFFWTVFIFFDFYF